MKVLFLDTRPVRRGAQVFINDLKKQFELSGINVRRIYLYREVDFECLPLNDHDEVLDFKDNHWLEKYFFFQPSLYKKLSQQIRDFNPDIILCNGSRTLKYGALVKFLSPELKSKWIYRVIDSAKYWNNKPFTSFIYRVFIISAMDAAVGVSNKSLSEMKSHYGFVKPSVVIPRAVDIDYFTGFKPEGDLRKKFKIENNSFILLFLGNFTKQKRPDRFIQILAGLRSMIPNLHGLMVGDGPLKNDIIREAKKLNIENYITLAGYQQDVRPYISISNLLVLTSDTEGMPGVVLEAAALKKASVCSDVGGIREFIDNPSIGSVLDDTSITSFLNEINRLFVQEKLILEMSHNAFLQVSNKYCLQVVSGNYLKFFNSILFK